MTTLRIARTVASVLCASVLCISCLCGIVAADGKDSRDSSAGQLQWVGDWEMSAEVNRILGFANAEDRRDATWVHPTSFCLSFDKEISKQFQPQTLNVYGDQFFKRIGHKVVATGKCETMLQGIGTTCVVTQKGGATFLWIEANYVVWFPLRVVLIQGRTRDHDLLVIDFNSSHDRLAGGQESHDTLAYKRTVEKQDAAHDTHGKTREAIVRHRRNPCTVVVNAPFARSLA